MNKRAGVSAGLFLPNLLGVHCMMGINSIINETRKIGATKNARILSAVYHNSLGMHYLSTFAACTNPLKLRQKSILWRDLLHSKSVTHFPWVENETQRDVVNGSAKRPTAHIISHKIEAGLFLLKIKGCRGHAADKAWDGLSWFMRNELFILWKLLSQTGRINFWKVWQIQGSP